jgi:hypothetical protein
MGGCGSGRSAKQMSSNGTFAKMPWGIVTVDDMM